MSKPMQTQFLLNEVSKFIHLTNGKVGQIVNELVDIILNKVKAKDTLFCRLFSEKLICGSYRDQIKINEPDEFDLNILLNLSKAKVVKNEENHPGFVKVDLSAYKCDENFKSFLQRFTNRRCFLLVSNLQSWFESCISRVKIHNSVIELRSYKFYVKVRKAGPAHTISFETQEAASDPYLTTGFRFSVDLVPGIQFDRDDWPSEIAPDRDNYKWVAIPKPLNGSGNAEHLLFVPSYSVQESHIMLAKNSKKNALRLIKKIRDRKNIQNLKSYFIKTVFLWKSKRKGSKFWDRSIDVIVKKMLNMLRRRLKRRVLKFYWHRKFNMLEKFSPTQIDTMRMQIESAIRQFRSYRNTNMLFDLFLTDKEKEQLLARMQKRAK